MRELRVRMLPVMALAATVTFADAQAALAQDAPRWQRREAATQTSPTIFHATHGLNLPTAVTPGGGELLFEIAHRFLPPISDAEDALFGLDGGVRLRLGLTYGLTDRLAVGLVRSNLDDNLDLNARFRVFETGGPVPLQVAAQAGYAWNTEVFGGAGSTTQAHGALIVNAGVGERVAIGVVPAIVQNPLVQVDGEDAAVSVGLHGQVYLTRVLSLVGEYVVSEARPGLPDDPASLSVELETGGHFFRVGVTNSLRLNTAQHFAGAAQPFEPGEWRLAFNVTRAIKF